jgi:hypothetical protein
MTSVVLQVQHGQNTSISGHDVDIFHVGRREMSLNIIRRPSEPHQKNPTSVIMWPVLVTMSTHGPAPNVCHRNRLVVVVVATLDL